MQNLDGSMKETGEKDCERNSLNTMGKCVHAAESRNSPFFASTTSTEGVKHTASRSGLEPSSNGGSSKTDSHPGSERFVTIVTSAFGHTGSAFTRELQRKRAAPAISI